LGRRQQIPAQETPASAGASSCQPLWAALGQHRDDSLTHPAALAQQPGNAAHWSPLLGGRELAEVDLAEVDWPQAQLKPFCWRRS